MISNIANFKPLHVNNNKVKACFCCYSADFDKYCERIVDDIIRNYSNIDIYYNSSDEIAIDDEDKRLYIECLKEFDLFIVPITYSFLVNKSIARDIDFAYALRNKCPVLPIAVDPYLEGVISKRFSGHGIADKLININNRTEYDAKLKTFFETLFPSQDLIKGIEDIFSSHLYIINNSNDLKAANKICNKIHFEYGYKNIGIYHCNSSVYVDSPSYIENSKIDNCDAVILLISNNLINLSNKELYERYEYALSINKPIIPIVIDDLSQSSYENKFNNLPKTYEIGDESLRRQIEKYCSYKDNYNYEESYNIGMAYLFSIDVEKNINDAIELIKYAAQNKYLPAIKYLSYVYSNGVFDSISRNKAIYYKNIELKYCLDSEQDKIWLSLAELYFRNRDYFYSRRYYQKCYKSYKLKYGEKNTRTISVYNSLGLVYLKSNNIRKAISIFKTCFEVRKEALGEDNIDTVESLILLASSYNKLGDHERSKDIDVKVFEMLSRIYGNIDMRTLKAMDNIANDYCDLKDYTKANEYNMKSYEIKKNNYGEHDIETIRSLKNIAKVYSRSGDYKKAIELNEQIYEILVSLFDIYYPQALDTLSDLSKDYYKLNNLETSKQLGEDVFNKRKEVLGESHPETLESLKDLIDIYERTGDHSRAVKLNEQYKQLYTSSFNYKRLFIILAIIILIYIILPIIVISISTLFRKH